MAQTPYNASSTSLNTLVQSASTSQWNSSGSSIIMQAKARAAHVHAYSRQFTLSSIPANEEVPPLPGKLASRTGKVRIQLTFDRPFFNAGGELSGRLEIQCSSSRSVMLADMIIELLGYEALAKDHLAPKIFHKTVLRLQDIRHPSQAVQENIDPDSEGYWMARKGRTIFPFRLNIQDTLPNSYDSKLGQVRYVASAIALMKANHHKEVVNHSREVFIYETWTTDDIALARQKSVKADTSKRLFMGGEGSLEMYAELTRTMVSSGGIAYVNVGVKNLTKKKIMGIKLSLWRHIAASHVRSSMSSQSSASAGIREQDNVKNYCEIVYKGEDFAFDNDDPRVVVLPVYIPSGVYSLRNTSYLHVQFFVQVSLMASMSKALAVELPIYIAHASSWSDPPPRIPRNFSFPLHEDEPVKKNKTGVFTKKKLSSNALHSNASSCSNSSVKKHSSTNGGLNSASTSGSAPTSLSGTPSTDSGLKDVNVDSSTPGARRSTLKDPDSPTSVLDFTQAGNLFVVNPDSVSNFHGSDTGSDMRQPLATRLVSTPRVLSTSIAPPSSLSCPLDRSTPLILHEQEHTGETGRQGQDSVGEQDFDMSRSVSASQLSLGRKEHEKLKPGKMGLRKTLAKLSIAIPSHGTSTSHSMGKSSRRSPGVRVTAATPRSLRSLDTSAEDLNSPGSESPVGDQSLSRQSSGSSMGSFGHAFDRTSRKSSIGSTRVMTVSPSPVSPDVNRLGMTRITSSNPGSVVPSAANSTVSSAVPSRATSPVFHSGLSSGADGHVVHGAGDSPEYLEQMNKPPAAPDVSLLVRAPIMEEMGREERFQPDARARNSLVAQQEARHLNGQSSTTIPNPLNEPWNAENTYSSTNLNHPELSHGSQTAKGIRDEYYYGKSGLGQIPAGFSKHELKVAQQENLDPRIWSADQHEQQFIEQQQRSVSINQIGLSQSATQTSFQHSEQPSAALLSHLPVGLILTPSQSPDRHHSGDEYSFQFANTGHNQSLQQHQSRSSSGHSYYDQHVRDPNVPLTQHLPTTLHHESHDPAVVTPLSRSSISRNLSQENPRTAYIVTTRSAPVSRVHSPQQDQFRARLGTFSPEIHSTPQMMLSNQARDTAPNYPIPDGVVFPHPIIPPSSSNSFHAAQLRLTLSDINLDRQPGVEGEDALIVSSSDNLQSAQATHLENRPTTPQQRHAAHNPAQQESNTQLRSAMDVGIGEQQTSSLLARSRLQAAMFSERGLNDQGQEGEERTRSLQGIYAVFDDETHQAPYQPRTQYAQYVSSVQAPLGRDLISDTAAESSLQVNTVYEGLSLQSEKTSMLASPLQPLPYPVPERPWAYQSAAVPVQSAEMVKHMDVLESTLTQETANAHNGGATTPSLQAAAERELSGNEAESEISIGVHIPQSYQSILADNPVLTRVSGHGNGQRYRMSPLAYDGNMMIAGASPPQPSEASQCIAPSSENKEDVEATATNLQEVVVERRESPV
ncbi:hypothetical protein BGX28_003281 [Mortierella sp. GBA30]|nr:hypothetical protein BGX28_003281 [Mortierella sp. GBA30]